MRRRTKYKDLLHEIGHDGARYQGRSASAIDIESSVHQRIDTANVEDEYDRPASGKSQPQALVAVTEDPCPLGSKAERHA